jgi:hypothetical protein
MLVSWYEDFFTTTPEGVVNVEPADVGAFVAAPDSLAPLGRPIPTIAVLPPTIEPSVVVWLCRALNAKRTVISINASKASFLLFLPRLDIA